MTNREYLTTLDSITYVSKILTVTSFFKRENARKTKTRTARELKTQIDLIEWLDTTKGEDNEK